MPKSEAYLGSDVFKEISDWDLSVGDVYGPQWEKALAKGAGVTLLTLRRAINRVRYDGYYGPVPDDEWYVAYGYRMPLARATEIVRDAYHNFDPPDFRISLDPGAMEDPTSAEIRDHFGDEPPTDEELQRWIDQAREENAPWASGANYPNEESFRDRYLHNVFSFYREIYGGYP